MERPGLESKTEISKIKVNMRALLEGQTGPAWELGGTLGGAMAVNLLASILTFSVTISSLIIWLDTNLEILLEILVQFWSIKPNLGQD